VDVYTRADNLFPNLSFTQVERYYSRRFGEAMQIYMKEFYSSRLPIAKVRSLLKTGSYQLFVAEEAGRILAMALLWGCTQPVFVHLDYIAVSRESKGRGIGTAFYRWLLEHLETFVPRAQLLTLEVEDDLLNFYRRSQTRILHEVPYLFPASHGPLPMHLMVYDRRGRRTLAGTLVQEVIRALYRGIHNRAADDALLRSFISRVPRQVTLL
jgi:ribosomal protein S18 acetylase RimI-like enzyme